MPTLTCNLPSCGRPLQTEQEFGAGLCAECGATPEVTFSAPVPRRRVVEVRVGAGLVVQVRPMRRCYLDERPDVEFWRAFHPRVRRAADGPTPDAAVRALGYSPLEAIA